MTNKEAIEVFNHPTEHWTSEREEAISVAIKVLEKSEHYKWHDLRKDPTDLPDVNICRKLVFAWRGWYCDWQECGWFHNDKEEVKPYFSTDSKHRLIGDDFFEVYAWKYIEPIEEEKK